MRACEIAEFTIKSSYGYEDLGRPPKIPGGATLSLTVELFQIGEELPEKENDNL